MKKIRHSMLLLLWAFSTLVAQTENILSVGDIIVSPGDTAWVEIDIYNDDQFVSFQFDLAYPDSIEFSGVAFLSDRAIDHELSLVDFDSLVRVISYSYTLAPFMGNPGKIVSIGFTTAQDSGTYNLNVLNPILGNVNSENILTGFENGSITVESSAHLWHVSTTGDDVNGDGSAENPFATIQHGIDMIPDGDTVFVSAGTYVENINFNGKNIAVIGEDRETTIITPAISNTPIITFENDEGITSESLLSDFTFTGGDDYTFKIVYGPRPTIKNCIITNNTNYYLEGTVRIDGAAPIFYNTLFYNNGNVLDFGPNPSAENYNTQLNNCTFVNNYGLGISENQSNPIIISNSIINDHEDSTIIGNYDIFYSNVEGYNDGIGNIDVSPMFVDTANGNYHLLASSQLINAGHPDSLDSDGTVADIGAYPYLTDNTEPVWYINTAGNDTTGTGTSVNPFASIQAGINFSSNTDSVTVAAGTYVENINFRGRNIKVVGADRETTIIDGNQVQSCVYFSGGANNPLLKNFTLQNGNGQYTGSNNRGGGGGVYVFGTSPKFENLIIKNNSSPNQGGGIAIFDSGENYQHIPIHISNVKFLNNSANSGGGLSTIAGDREVFINNCIFNGNFVDIGGGSGGGAIYSKGGVVKKFINQCTFIQNSGSGSVFKADHGDSTIFTNSIFYDNDGTEIYIERVDENTDEIYVGIQYSLTDFEFDSMYVSTGSTLENLGGNIDIDPMFADTANGNYHLLASSQLINAGHPDSTDSDGSRADIGAYPYLNSYSGPTWYITEDGNDTTATGATDDPFRSIQAGINFSSDADSVTVAAGTYVENINFRGRNIAVVGADRETTIIDGNQNGSVVTIENLHEYGSGTWASTRDDALMKGFTIRNGGGTYANPYGEPQNQYFGGGIWLYNASPTLEDMTISGNFIDAWGGGIFLHQYCAPLITNVTINNNTADRGGGISLYYSNPVLNNVAIYANTANQGGGIYSYHNTNPILSNVTITNNTAEQGGSIYSEEGTSVNVFNTVLWNNVPQEIFLSGESDTITFAYSDVQGGQDSIVTNDNGTVIWGEGNIDVDPMFLDYENSDYHLADWSPCIGSGENSVDMGAYENVLDEPIEHIVISSDFIFVSEDSLATVDFRENDLVFNVSFPVLSILDSSSHGSIIAAGDSLLTYIPMADFAGYDTVEYAFNGITAADTGFIYITVSPIDDLPTSNGLVDMVVNEDAPDSTLGDLNTYFTDIDGDLVFSHTNTHPGLVSVSVENDMVTLSFTPDSNGVATIVFTASNPARASVSDTLIVTVNAVNDAPTVNDLAIEVLEDGSIEIPFSGIDIDDDSLSFTIVDSPINGLFTGGIYSPNGNFTGIDSLTYVANDGMVNSNLGMVLITVTNTNDAPYVSQAMSDIEVDEDANDLSLLINGVFDDADIIINDTLTITAISLNTDLIITGSDSNAVPFISFIPNANGETDVVITATDLEGLFVNDTVHVMVNAVNDAPSAFELLQVDSLISITSENIATGMAHFEWTASSDVDGDDIQYTFGWVQPGAWYGGDSITNATSIDMSYQEVYDMITTQSDTTSWWWYVEATDGVDTTGASPDSLTIQWDISDMLSIDDDLMPLSFALHQNYPNPFNPTTTLQYDLPEDAQVKIMIYDLMGREVKTLVNNQQTAGFKSIIWNASNNLGQPVSAGMYLYRISAGDFHSVKKMILLK